MVWKVERDNTFDAGLVRIPTTGGVTADMSQETAEYLHVGSNK